MDTREVVVAIGSGEFDGDFDLLERAIQLRKDRINRGKMARFAWGDEVVIKGIGMGGKYLNGAIAQIVDIKQKRVTVQITKMPWGDDGRKRFHVGSKVILYAEHVEPVPVIEGTARDTTNLKHLASEIGSVLNEDYVKNVTPEAD